MVFAVDPYSIPSMITGQLQSERIRPKRATRGPSTICFPRRRSRRMPPLRRRRRSQCDGTEIHLAINGLDRRDFLACSGGDVGRAAGRVRLARAEVRRQAAQYAERKNQVVERELFRHTSMDVVPSGAHDAGNKLPELLHLADRSGVGRERARKVDARGQRSGRESGASHARRSAETAAGIEPREPLLRRRLDGGRDVDRRAVHASWQSWSARPPDAHYVDFQSFDDDYHESWDIESAMHPQTLSPTASTARCWSRRMARRPASTRRSSLATRTPST